MSNFVSLPRELRDQIYELCLLHQGPLNPWFDFYQGEKRTSGLFRVSKSIHAEASQLSYSRNCFDFALASSENIARFLKTIGRNVDYIRHIRVNFPQLLSLESGGVALGDNDASILATIQGRCTDLSTITTSFNNTTPTGPDLDLLDDLKFFVEALELVDTRFRAMTSLEEINIGVFELYVD
ncbi:hypothetical protein F5Y19DRAFT_447218 [Xylariaceae sp. FL1651]|nr:hypothetical protein F5Y19DRAFT_447218 [Xylariaceae sp. FL1651]